MTRLRRGSNEVQSQRQAARAGRRKCNAVGPALGQRGKDPAPPHARDLYARDLLFGTVTTDEQVGRHYWAQNTLFIDIYEPLDDTLEELATHSQSLAQRRADPKRSVYAMCAFEPISQRADSVLLLTECRQEANRSGPC